MMYRTIKKECIKCNKIKYMTKDEVVCTTCIHEEKMLNDEEYRNNYLGPRELERRRIKTSQEIEQKRLNKLLYSKNYNKKNYTPKKKQIETIQIEDKTFDIVKCSKCKIIKYRHKGNVKYINNKWLYLDECGKRWEGKICPRCLKEKNDQRNLLKRKLNPITKKLSNVNCLHCNINFKPKKKAQKFCKRECGHTYNITNKLNGPKIKKIKYPVSTIVYNTCKVCNTTKIGRKKKKFCSITCRKATYRKTEQFQKQRSSPEAKALRKEMKRLRKRQVRQAKLKSVSWNDIQLCYDYCPIGLEVDHILPLKGELICGLHVPWNFQYLTPKENNDKGSKFDGTYNNKNWKKYINNNSQVTVSECATFTRPK